MNIYKITAFISILNSLLLLVLIEEKVLAIVAALGWFAFAMDNVNIMLNSKKTVKT